MLPLDADHHTTTPLDPRVLEAMLPYLLERHGTPTALYARGRRLAADVESARAAVARLFGAEPEEILFTASATEANNLIVKGVARPGRRLAAATEHHSVLHPLRSLERSGVATTLLPVDKQGRLDLDTCREALSGGAALLSVAYASAEIGTLQPMPEIVALAQAAGTPVHADAVAIAGRVAFTDGPRPDFEVITPHLFNGPAGIAALRIRRGSSLRPLVEGGIQEGGLRAGTLPVAAVVGFGRAAELSLAEGAGRAVTAERLARELRSRLAAALPDATFTGDATARIPGHLSLVVRGAEAEALLRGLDEAGIEASSGSACLAGAGKPSHVLLACGVDPAAARGALTFSFGAGNRPEDPERIATTLTAVAARLRALSPL
ncbi:MAG TPA: cysteine desulfurase family protein [Candidatus Polarisedimenticolia bacterium]|nr:cysteine desulfurase family protein [Candidatus Polarisedimenticolia bacterium]